MGNAKGIEALSKKERLLGERELKEVDSVPVLLIDK